MTALRRGDRDLHDPETGEHRTTAPTTNGRALARYERRIREHLAAHMAEGEPMIPATRSVRLEGVR